MSALASIIESGNSSGDSWLDRKRVERIARTLRHTLDDLGAARIAVIIEALDRVDRRLLMQALFVAHVREHGARTVNHWLDQVAQVGREPTRTAHAAAAKAPPAAKAPKPAPDAATIEWSGQRIAIGPATAALNDRRRSFVLHLVRGGLAVGDAAKAAGFTGKHAADVQYAPAVKAAIAELRGRGCP